MSPMPIFCVLMTMTGFDGIGVVIVGDRLAVGVAVVTVSEMVGIGVVGVGVKVGVSVGEGDGVGDGVGVGVGVLVGQFPRIIQGFTIVLLRLGLRAT